MPNEITILDTTLRDGEQSPGLAFSVDEKVIIASLLAEIGVPIIEVGTPIMGGDEAESVKAIIDKNLSSTILTWNRMVYKDVKASLDCGIKHIHISSPVSDIQLEKKLNFNRLKLMKYLTSFLSDLSKGDIQLSCGLEDASRADRFFLAEICQLLEENAVSRVRICDTVGILTPFQTFDLIQFLKKHINIEIEIHSHNDYGLATANALAAIQAGATCVDTTILGIGERAGNSSFEELVLALNNLMNMNVNINTSRLSEIADYVSLIINREIPFWKPIVGSNAFTHESGLHVDGILKDPKTYEPFPPELIGRKRKLVIGKHSGRHAIKNVFQNMGIQLDEWESVELLSQVRQKAVETKKSLNDFELLELYNYVAINKKLEVL